MSYFPSSVFETLFGFPELFENVDVEGSSNETTETFVVGTQYSMMSTVDCHVLIGTTPTATTSDMVLSAGERIPFRVSTGSDELSVIKASGADDGILSIWEHSRA